MLAEILSGWPTAHGQLTYFGMVTAQIHYKHRQARLLKHARYRPGELLDVCVMAEPGRGLLR